MPDIGIPELLIILVIVLVLFGPGRLAGVGSALGQSIREFSQGLKGRPEIDEVLEETKTDKKTKTKNKMEQSGEATGLKHPAGK